jgi:hypothetical protein
VHGRALAEVAGPMTTGDIIAADVKVGRIAELVKQNKTVNLALEREKVPLHIFAVARVSVSSSVVGEQQSVANPQAARGRARLLCILFKNQSCFSLGSVSRCFPPYRGGSPCVCSMRTLAI